jgi:hypothetical protein
MTLVGRTAITRLVIVLSFAAAPASAQTDFTGLKAGPATSFSSRARWRAHRTARRSLAVKHHVNQETIPYEPGLKIARRASRLLNGIIMAQPSVSWLGRPSVPSLSRRTAGGVRRGRCGSVGADWRWSTGCTKGTRRSSLRAAEQANCECAGAQSERRRSTSCCCSNRLRASGKA